MKTIKQIQKEYVSKTLDGRDLSRLSQFIPEKELKNFGLKLQKKYIGKHKHKLLTKKNILKQLKKDVEFGFEKALDQRGLSAGMMYEVVSMWNWILEEGLENFEEYAQHGLPLFKATALKYKFNNPIGKDKGNENKYAG